MSLLKKQAVRENKVASFTAKGHAVIVKPQDQERLRQLDVERGSCAAKSSDGNFDSNSLLLRVFTYYFKEDSKTFFIETI